VASLHLHFYLPSPPTTRSIPLPTTSAVSSQIPQVRILVHLTVLTLLVLSWIFQTKAVSGTADFKKSLQDTDFVVVYLGHAVLDYKDKRSLGLSPLGHHTAEIAPDALVGLLKDSKAKLVILASCTSSTLGLKD
jgi:hypothetical protein